MPVFQAVIVRCDACRSEDVMMPLLVYEASVVVDPRDLEKKGWHGTYESGEGLRAICPRCCKKSEGRVMSSSERDESNPTPQERAERIISINLLLLTREGLTKLLCEEITAAVEAERAACAVLIRAGLGNPRGTVK